MSFSRKKYYTTTSPNDIFVGGLSPITTEQELHQLFSKYGKLVSTKIVSYNGISKGYGFVTFENQEDARYMSQEVMSVNLGNRRLNIQPALKKSSYPSPVLVENTKNCLLPALAQYTIEPSPYPLVPNIPGISASSPVATKNAFAWKTNNLDSKFKNSWNEN